MRTRTVKVEKMKKVAASRRTEGHSRGLGMWNHFCVFGDGGK